MILPKSSIFLSALVLSVSVLAAQQTLFSEQMASAGKCVKHPSAPICSGPQPSPNLVDITFNAACATTPPSAGCTGPYWEGVFNNGPTSGTWTCGILWARVVLTPSLGGTDGEFQAYEYSSGSGNSLGLNGLTLITHYAPPAPDTATLLDSSPLWSSHTLPVIQGEKILPIHWDAEATPIPNVDYMFFLPVGTGGTLPHSGAISYQPQTNSDWPPGKSGDNGSFSGWHC
jgi:hypothetical protein